MGRFGCYSAAAAAPLDALLGSLIAQAPRRIAQINVPSPAVQPQYWQRMTRAVQQCGCNDAAMHQREGTWHAP